MKCGRYQDKNARLSGEKHAAGSQSRVFCITVQRALPTRPPTKIPMSTSGDKRKEP